MFDVDTTQLQRNRNNILKLDLIFNFISNSFYKLHENTFKISR